MHYLNAVTTSTISVSIIISNKDTAENPTRSHKIEQKNDDLPITPYPESKNKALPVIDG